MVVTESSVCFEEIAVCCVVNALWDRNGQRVIEAGGQPFPVSSRVRIQCARILLGGRTGSVLAACSGGCGVGDWNSGRKQAERSCQI